MAERNVKDKMKAYLIVYGYEDEYEIDSVFLDKEKAKAYVSANNQIPFDKYNAFRIEEVELNPPAHNKPVVEVHGYINRNKEIQDIEIERIDRNGLKLLEHFVNNDIYLYSGKLYGVEDVIFFDGMVDVTPCKDLTKCDKYIKDIIAKKLCEYKSAKVKEGE